MKRRATTSLSILVIALSGPAMAATFDGSQPIICATLAVHTCQPGEKCTDETVESIDAPQFFNVLVPENNVTGTRPSGANVDAKIDLVRHSSNIMFLQGGAGDIAWTMAIDEESGRMSGTISEGDGVDILFGACIPR
jgi:hypothetical protein